MLLVVAGAAKLARPADGFAGLVGLRARPSLVRVLGGAEVVAGAGALWSGGPVAASAVGLLYAMFAVAVLRALAVGAESCGCFGRLDAPPSRIHVLGNLVLAGASFAAAGTGTAPAHTIVQSFSDRPAVGAALVTEILLVAGLALVAFTALPEALGARTSRPASATLFRAVTPPATRPGRAVTPPTTRISETVPAPGRRR